VLFKFLALSVTIKKQIQFHQIKVLLCITCHQTIHSSFRISDRLPLEQSAKIRSTPHSSSLFRPHRLCPQTVNLCTGTKRRKHAIPNAKNLCKQRGEGRPGCAIHTSNASDQS